MIKEIKFTNPMPKAVSFSQVPPGSVFLWDDEAYYLKATFPIDGIGAISLSSGILCKPEAFGISRCAVVLDAKIEVDYPRKRE